MTHTHSLNYTLPHKHFQAHAHTNTYVHECAHISDINLLYITDEASQCVHSYLQQHPYDVTAYNLHGLALLAQRRYKGKAICRLLFEFQCVENGMEFYEWHIE